MNTITINTTNEDSTTQSSITYTETEVLNFINKVKDLNNAWDRCEELSKQIRTIRNEVRDFFSEGEWSDGETTCNKGDVNAMLDRIGCSKLTSKYSGTFTVTGTFNVEVEDEDEVESMIADNIEVSVWGADIDVDSVEVMDIEEDN